MTYSELLHSVPFSDIEPCLVRLYQLSPMQTGWVKLHYDFMRQLTPCLDPEDVEHNGPNAKIVYWHDDPDPTSSGTADAAGDDARPRAPFCSRLEGVPFASALALPLDIDPEVQATPAELAAGCLWHSSWYGAYDQQSSRTMRDMVLHGREDDYAFIRRRYGPLLPTPRMMMRSSATFRARVHEDMAAWRVGHKGIRGRAKRRRQMDEWHRFLDSMGMGKDDAKRRRAKREAIRDHYREAITDIGRWVDAVLCADRPAVSPAPTAEELWAMVRQSSSMWSSAFRTFVGVGDRCAYLSELVERYQFMMEAETDGTALLCVTTSAAHPLAADERGVLLRRVGSGHAFIVERRCDDFGSDMEVVWGVFQ